ncbi:MULTISPECIES: hypothetical protein [Pseudoalteromonas]|uniref:Uncharacterized protein n=1 Tax=Pseudoalteromonas lipolytica TaxID=570156 RepID=A0AAD0S0W6_9GAMM|nr:MULTISPECIES: hypothetical protein [Pseudoalteromonas]MAE01733.1 hypothetical protein [Pseudoalteromonas sp.]AXV65957.1 hypothetical protein D0907_12085 [Pseudoalteromonas donghaensis]MBE0350295.1 hypothetical protein [Pseudoalteromonas lipolytica LMEB 39]MCC9659530.1 hypothetical protein [Pseudoalteromonas sp. MB41]QLJ07477.1 hypothetical protein GZH31_11850 [Pseudoalteromonas sp. JSTW]
MYFILLILFSAISLTWFFLRYKKLSKEANNYVKINYAEQWQTYESKARLMRATPNSIVFHSIKQGELSAINDGVLKSFKKKHQYIVTLLCISPLLSSLLAQFIAYLMK